MNVILDKDLTFESIIKNAGSFETLTHHLKAYTLVCFIPGKRVWCICIPVCYRTLSCCSQLYVL